MDAEITPEPTDEERAAIIAAIEASRSAGGVETEWWQAGLADASDDDGDDP